MMAADQNETVLQEIEELRVELIGKVNANMDALIQRIQGVGEDDGAVSEYEYPLGAASSLLKGTKPTAVIFGGERVEATTWKKVYTEILRRCSADEKTHDMLMDLRGKIGGRKRMVLSDQPGGMNKPVLISEGLYAESFFDTEWTLRMLVQILDAVHFDYSVITIAVNMRR